jgi:ATP-dependent Clp protease ATP-binding subunit ClpX
MAANPGSKSGKGSSKKPTTRKITPKEPLSGKELTSIPPEDSATKKASPSNKTLNKTNPDSKPSVEEMRDKLKDVEQAFLKAEEDAEIVETAMRRAEAARREKEHIEMLDRFYKPLNDKMKDYVNRVKEYIIGQDKAVEDIVYLVYHNMHQNMLEDIWCVNGTRLPGICIGPSGCGKTATLNVVSGLFGIPFLKYNATPLTSAGFVGRDVETMLKQLLEKAGGDLFKAERGILYIDEIDKKKSAIGVTNTTGRDVNGTVVQQELLKFLEPSEIDLGDGIIFDTTHLTIIMTGAFLGIEEYRNERLGLNEKTAGFKSDKPKEYETFQDDPFQDDYNEFDQTDSPDYIDKDIMKYGFIAEFVGRVRKIIEFKQLTADDMVSIITTAKGSKLIEFVNQLKLRNIELEIRPENYYRMAEAALSDPELGARALENMILTFLEPAKKDFMDTFLAGTGQMYYDFDGNYTYMFESEMPHMFVENYVEGKRQLRRLRLAAERDNALKEKQQQEKQLKQAKPGKAKPSQTTKASQASST